LTDDIRTVIAQGESAQVEFKATLRFDLRTRQVNKALPKVVGKTMAGFLNAEGGTLLIGVSDDGEVTGLQLDLDTLTRKNLDGFELTLRNVLGRFLGLEVASRIDVEFAELDGRQVAMATCRQHSSPVFFQDSDRSLFYVRAGNQTFSLDLPDAFKYIADQWPTDQVLNREDVKDTVREVLKELSPPPPSAVLANLPGGATPGSEIERVALADGGGIGQPTEGRGISPGSISEPSPPWLKIGTRKVIDLFLEGLVTATGWNRIYIVSPWISDFTESASLTFDRLLSRLTHERATAYVVTRPPTEEWHQAAIQRLGETGRANVALVPDLHAKLYTARTDSGSFALLASANFTQKSLGNRELGMLVNAFSTGRSVVKKLDHEAAEIYRSPGRRLLFRAQI
jgi:hypothetical protein